MASVEVLVGPERRRRWSVEQKQAIVAAAFGPGAVVRDVARQADVTPSLIYRWRRDLRAAANGFAQVLVAPAGSVALMWRDYAVVRTPVFAPVQETGRWQASRFWLVLSDVAGGALSR